MKTILSTCEATNLLKADSNARHDEQDDEDKEADALAWLQDHMEVVTFPEGVIIRNF